MEATFGGWVLDLMDIHIKKNFLQWEARFLYGRPIKGYYYIFIFIYYIF